VVEGYISVCMLYIYIHTHTHVCMLYIYIHTHTLFRMYLFVCNIHTHTHTHAVCMLYIYIHSHTHTVSAQRSSVRGCCIWQRLLYMTMDVVYGNGRSNDMIKYYTYYAIIYCNIIIVLYYRGYGRHCWQR
jgi:hypothetical protein